MKTKDWAARATLLLTAAILIVPVKAAGDLDVRNRDGVAYVSGGVSTEEVHALQSVSARFNLKLTMATNTGHYLADVRVRIQDPRGQTVLDTVADGPLLFAQLRPGTYVVSCDEGGKTVTQTVHVTHSQRQLTFSWASERLE